MAYRPRPLNRVPIGWPRYGVVSLNSSLVFDLVCCIVDWPQRERRSLRPEETLLTLRFIPSGCCCSGNGRRSPSCCACRLLWRALPSPHSPRILERKTHQGLIQHRTSPRLPLFNILVELSTASEVSWSFSLQKSTDRRLPFTLSSIGPMGRYPAISSRRGSKWQGLQPPGQGFYTGLRRRSRDQPDRSVLLTRKPP